MQSLPRRTPVQQGYAVLSTLVVTVACNRLLGVDGEYELRQGAIEAGAPSPPVQDGSGWPPPPGAGGTGTGGVLPAAAGGTNETGGVDAGGWPNDAAGGADAGKVDVPPDAGPGVTDPPPPPPPPPCTVCPLTCTAVTYQGSVTGRHKIANVFFDVWSPIEGSLELVVEPGTGPLLPRLRGTLIGNPAAGTAGGGTTLHGRLEGTLDCTSGKVSAMIEGGTRTAITRQNIEGSFSGTVGAGDALSGTFTEWETANPALNGNGDWSATRTSP